MNSENSHNYVSVSDEAQKIKTRVIDDTAKPIWNEYMEVGL